MIRRPPPIAAVAKSYDDVADGFDEKWRDPLLVRRFNHIDAPQRTIATGAAWSLELGCGTGRLLASLPGRARVGIDLSLGMLRAAKRRGLATLRADAHCLPFADQSFDAITSGNGVFRYLDYERAFAECARVLRPGGRLAVHQYARTPRVLMPFFRGESPAPANPLHVAEFGELLVPAARAGLTEERRYLFRTLRVPPYVLRIPSFIAGLRLWNHVTFVFRKPGPHR